jgi:hypothetical protein
VSADVAIGSPDWYNEDSASPLTVNRPVGTATGDLLVAIIVQHAPTGHLTDLTAPDGTWTEQGNYAGTNSQGKVFTHVAAGGDPSTWDFPYYVNADTCLGMFRVQGADTTPVVVVTSTNTTSLTSSYDSPTVTPTGSDDLLICTISDISNGVTFTTTIPASMTTRNKTQIAGGFMAEAGASQQLLSSSPTGAKTWTSVTPASVDGGSFSVAIKSAAAGGAQPAGSVNATIPPQLLYMLLIRNASSQAAGTPQQTVSPLGIASSESLGAATVTTTVNVAPQGIPSSEQVGNAAVTSAVGVTPQGIASSESLGNPTVTTSYSVTPQGIPTQQALGNASISSTVGVTPQGIPSSESLGNPTVQVVVAVNAGSIASGEQFGNPTITPGPVNVAVNGIPSSERLGSPTVSVGGALVFAGGIPSGEKLGSPTVAPGAVNVQARGVASSETFGLAQVSLGALTININAGSITSGERFGAPFVGPQVRIDATYNQTVDTVSWRADPPVEFEADDATTSFVN